MVNEDMPFYNQFPNACGLTSLLMALKPPSRHIDEILNEGWDKAGLIFFANPAETVEYRWQRILEYLLTASTQHPPLRAYLIENLPTFKTELLPWIENNLAKVAGKLLVHGKPNPKLLRSENIIMRRVRTMKHNVELKVLAYLFGCEFVPWEKTPDGTGAVFFTKDEFTAWRRQEDGDSFEEKLAFIQAGIESENPIVWGASFHWLAPRDIQVGKGQATIYYHDPMGGGDHSIKMTSLREVDRFYRFQFDPELLSAHVRLLQEVFESPNASDAEMPKEEEDNPQREQVPEEGNGPAEPQEPDGD